MPKMKTKKSASKRFRIQSSGKIKRGNAFKRHLLLHKTSKRKNNLTGGDYVNKSDCASVRAMMPYA